MVNQTERNEGDIYKEKAAECAREARHQAALLPEGPVRDALLEKARQYERRIPGDSGYR
jgi:hypothetical protein